MFEIIKSKTESDKIEDFVAIGNIVNENGEESIHAAFIINIQKELYEFHYTGKSVEYYPIINEYFHKITDTIPSEEVPAFVALSRQLLKKANPVYGFFYSGEYYNENGHQHNPYLGERMTCVGFCLNVFKTYLEEDYIVWEDWNVDSERYLSYLKRYCEANELEVSQVQQSFRRITPRECLTSCFFVKLPISKHDIETRIHDVNRYFEQRFSIGDNNQEQNNIPYRFPRRKGTTSH